MWPLLIGGAIALYLYKKNQSSAPSSTTTASNGTSVTLPGLYVPTTLTLTSDDVAVARSVLDGSYIDPGSGQRIDSLDGGQTAAQRLNYLNQVLVDWGEVGRSSNAPDLRTVLRLG